MFMSDFMSYITENAIVLIPVLYIIGTIFKNTEKFPDKYIPLILLPIGIALSVWIMGMNVESVIQGVLVTGATVYTNQLVKQQKKTE